MSTYDRSARQRLHYRLRRWQRIINTLLALSIVLALLLAVAPVAQAGTRCPGGTATPDGCSYELPGITCAWPLRLVRVGNVAYCWRPAPEVQP